MTRALIVATVAVSGVEALRFSACDANDFGARAFLQSKLVSMGVVCEDMCKRTGAYPNCQCAGFDGIAAASGPDGGDDRSCVDRNCQDPTNKCPNEGFVNCVKADTTVSALQWPALLARVSRAFSVNATAKAADEHGTNFLS